ncbi:MAG: leucyl/phenylalanyl-tRNA--protein transferase [Solimicrobium sp.]|jgi:leucyl/phenylalanyl-tRNA--protein transferase|nr:leucyl/phenylalanyl-tRNA--protein transferase [Solimicrobium sp.]
MIPWLEVNTPFPSVHSALTKEQGAAGLLAAGADLSAERLLDAYRHGIFPWFSEEQPILWWSTDPRMVLYTHQFKLSKSLKKTLNKFKGNPNVEFKFDSAFESVMRACAAPRRDGAGTWISEQMVGAYSELHRLGYAHSSEVWMNGELVGGAYGLCIGRMFYGESMFSKERDTSKMALAQLVFFLKSQNVRMIDCQQETGHLASLGAIPISRNDFIQWIEQAVLQPPIIEWKIGSAEA